MLSLAVFLGNPGPEYERNRHNAGRLLLEKMPFYSCLSWHKKHKGSFAPLPGDIAGASGGGGTEGGGILLTNSRPASPQTPFYFLVPEAYMNLSGRAVRAAAAFYKIPPEKIIAVHDELELPLGTLSLKKGGGLGGHNGLRSIKEELGSVDFWRLRIGIGRPPGRAPGEGGPPVKGVHAGGSGEIAGWVLSDFSAPEESALEAALEAGAELLIRLLSEEPDKFLPEWKKKKIEVISSL